MQDKSKHCRISVYVIHDVLVRVHLILPTVLTAIFNYFRDSHSLSTHSHSEKIIYISVNIALSHILTIQIKFKKSIIKDFECCQYFKISKYLSLTKASEKTISLNIFQFDSKRMLPRWRNYFRKKITRMKCDLCLEEIKFCGIQN